jgi:hypothetical protein
MKGDNWNLLPGSMQNKTLLTLDRANAAGLGVMFFEGHRTVEDELKNIEKGTSKVTDPYNTVHLWGGAVDIVFENALGLPYWPEADDPRWEQLATIAATAGLSHPISWDKPHFQDPDFNIKTVRAAWGEDFEGYLQTKGVTFNA